MHQQRIRFALIQGGLFGFIITIIKGLIHLKRLGLSKEWVSYMGNSGAIFIIGSIVLYYLLMWPLKKRLDEKTAQRYKKEIEKDSKSQNQ